MSGHDETPLLDLIDVGFSREQVRGLATYVSSSKSGEAVTFEYIDERIDDLDKSVDRRIKNLQWVVIGGLTLITVIVGAVGVLTAINISLAE